MAAEYLSNVRLQARAARGAPPCKPLLGGMRSRSAPAEGLPVDRCQSFDHAVRASQEGLRNAHTDRLGSLQIDDELKLGRLHDR